MEPLLLQDPFEDKATVLIRHFFRLNLLLVLLEGQDHLDLNRDSLRQVMHPHGTARMLATVTEHLDKQF